MLKKIIIRIIKVMKNPMLLLIFLNNKKILVLPDKVYLKIRYRAILHERLNFENPQTFNSKLQWLKIYDRNPKYIKLVDKCEVKDYIKERIGEKYLIQTLNVWDNVDDIDFNKLPSQFVLKCTHDSGSTIICKDKNKMNYKKTIKRLRKLQKRDYYNLGREWPYKNVKPRIIAEKYMEDKKTQDINDYKFYCFNGKVDYVMVCTERKTGNPKFYYYDRKWKLQKDMSKDAQKNSKIYVEKPEKIEEMFNIASNLSEGIPFVRIDLYYINNEIYFGEFTFYPSSGFDNTRTDECDQILTKYLKLGE